MRNPKRSDDLAVRAVLGAAAQEAEELLAHVPDLEPSTVDEALRRLTAYRRYVEGG